MSDKLFNLETFWRILKLGYVNFWRNRWLTLGATLLMTLTLIMISVTFLFSFIVRDTAEIIRSKIDVTIYFRDDQVSDDEIRALAEKINTDQDVQAINFIDKEKALEIWQRLPINEVIKKPVSAENNPLPRSIQVDTADPEMIQGVVDRIAQLDTENLVCDECVSYSKNKDTVDQLVALTRFIQRTGLFLSILFGVIAIFNVLNIIRITITARSDEIEIMRYVGASNAFVRGPFIIEGIFYGVLGTIITTGSIILISRLINPYINIAFSVLGIDFQQYVLSQIWTLVSIQLLIGVFLGILVSTVSIRRYLKA
jgi:cell division transport system permease protein